MILMFPKQFTLRSLLLAMTLVAAYGAAYRYDRIRDSDFGAMLTDCKLALEEHRNNDALRLATAAVKQRPGNGVARRLEFDAFLAVSNDHLNPLPPASTFIPEIPLYRSRLGADAVSVWIDVSTRSEQPINPLQRISSLTDE